LELSFSTKALRELCESETKAKSQLGQRLAEKLRRRLADLRAARCVQDLVAGQPRVLKDTSRPEMAVDLSESCRLVFVANHRNVALLATGGVAWLKVSRVKIVRIERDYGQEQHLPT
jgi:hypothetical protein